MDEKIKCWILLALSNSPKRGENITELSLKDKPDSFNLDLSQLVKYLKDLEKEGYVVIRQKPLILLYSISPGGKKELRRLLRSNPDEHQELIKFFPEIELRKKIENIEAFIFGTVLFITSYLMLTDKVTENLYLNYLIISVMFFSFGFAGASFLSIVSSVIEKLKISLLYRLSDLLENNKERIGYILVALANVVGIYILKTYPKYTNEQIVGIIIVELLIFLIYKSKEISNYFKSKNWIKG